MNGVGPPPALPPTGAFFGDALALTAQAGAAGSGTVVLTASRAGAPGVVVEILAQGLAAAHRKAKPRDWTSKGFLTFAAGTLTQSVARPRGAWAVAYRFVEAATGRETAMAVIGKITVGLRSAAGEAALDLGVDPRREGHTTCEKEGRCRAEKNVRRDAAGRQLAVDP